MIVRYKKHQDELSEDAFSLFYKIKILKIYSRVYHPMVKLSSLEDLTLELDFTPPYPYKTILEEFMSLKLMYPSHDVEQFYPLYMVPFDKIAPPYKALHHQIRMMYLHNNLSSKDFYYWLRGYQPEFYDGRQDIVNSMLNGFYNAKQIFKLLSANQFTYTLTGVKKNGMNSFTKKHLDEPYHINDILKMKNGSLEPVLFFGGGLGDYGKFEIYLS